MKAKENGLNRVCVENCHLVGVVTVINFVQGVLVERGWLVLVGWFTAADRLRCRQCSGHQLVLRLRHCCCFHQVKGNEQRMKVCCEYEHNLH